MNFRNRYMIVEYSDEQQKKFLKEPLDDHGNFKNHLPIHHLLGSCHWAQLDKEHIILLGDYEISNHVQLQNHPAVTMLPHLSSSKKLVNAVKKKTHFEALNKRFNT